MPLTIVNVGPLLVQAPELLYETGNPFPDRGETLTGPKGPAAVTPIGAEEAVMDGFAASATVIV